MAHTMKCNRSKIRTRAKSSNANRTSSRSDGIAQPLVPTLRRKSEASTSTWQADKTLDRAQLTTSPRSKPNCTGLVRMAMIRKAQHFKPSHGHPAPHLLSSRAHLLLPTTTNHHLHSSKIPTMQACKTSR